MKTKGKCAMHPELLICRILGTIGVVMKTIRELREQRGMSQMDLAVEIGVTLPTIGNWERNIYEPKASQFRKLARFFGVPMDEIAIPTVDTGDECTDEQR
ncbi:MAG: helix-turn-helix transcriptional regulator [Thermomicrobiales bacterium]